MPKRTHGLSQNKSSTYRSWLMMRNRCNNTNAIDFKYYGGRGIKVCQRWNSFLLFRKDMGDKPTPRHTIGRKNSKGNYSPRNCRWETRRQQSQSRKYCKLSISKANKMKKLRAKGWTYLELAKKFNVGKTTAGYAAIGKTWAK